MEVKVVYFAAARDLTSSRSETLNMDPESSVESLASVLLTRHPALKKLERSIRFSVNFELADPATRLRDGDEVGVLPPVAGG